MKSVRRLYTGRAVRETCMSKQLETRLKIVAATNELMKTTSPTKVRVVDVCKEVGISRTTFYEYFEDIPAVSTWFWDHLMNQTLYLIGTKYSCFEAHLRKFTIMREHQEFLYNSFLVTSYPWVVQHGGRQMYDIYEEVLARKLARPLNRSESLHIEFFVTGAKHMTRHWVEGHMVDSPELMAHIFTSAMPAFALPLLEPDNRPEA